MPDINSFGCEKAANKQINLYDLYFYNLIYPTLSTNIIFVVAIDFFSKLL